MNEPLHPVELRHAREIGPYRGKATAQFLAEPVRPRPDRERGPVLAGKQLRPQSSTLSAREGADRLAKGLAAVAGHPAPSSEHRAPSAEGRHAPRPHRHQL
jgi:hypothetical protein